MRHALIALLVATLLVACGSSTASQAPDVDATGKPSKSMRIGGNIRVLVVDDSSYTRSTFAKMLTQENGYVVSSAENGEMAMKLLNDTAQELLPHIIFTDDYMPGQSGFELTQVITSHERYRSIPVIMMVADYDAESVQKAKQSGARGWLSVPVNPYKVISLIEKLVAP